MGIPTVVTIHDLVFKQYPEQYAWFDRQVYDLKFRYACQNSDLIVAISESTKQDIMRFYGTPAEKIDVLYQACNPIFYTLQSQESVDKIIKQYHQIYWKN